MSTPQMQAEGVCLKFPNDVGLHSTISLDQAVAMLLRGTGVASTTPFQWGYIDQPKENQAFLIFLPNQTPFPNDGIRYLEQEQKWSLPAPQGREVEAHEIKYGFVPNSSDPNAWRMRRRFRIVKGGHPNLVLVHYTRVQGIPIMPSLLNQPIRTYPLRPVSEPPVFIAGEKAGMKIPGPGTSGGPMGLNNIGGMGMNIHQQQALLAQQNNSMDLLERKRLAASGAGVRPPAPFPPRAEEVEELEDGDLVSSRALSMARYRRNHELMNDVFKHAAYRGKFTQIPPVPYAIFDKKKLEEQTHKLEAEIEALNVKSVQRRNEGSTSAAFNPDISMDTSITV